MTSSGDGNPKRKYCRNGCDQAGIRTVHQPFDRPILTTNGGLIALGTQALISHKVIDVVDNFQQAVDKMKEEGAAALCDALALTAYHLGDMKFAYPQIKKTMVCRSDGVGTNSLKSIEDTYRNITPA
ncbi:hypothetical protein CLCR_11015 [Cladophialophora carrionii]|uniref:Uncharacterized protein n=1 Tax=Cladophialophora carrionii TaxID=86049 RepID=A0A1C1CYG5_9EURO|nr:hypothetical protein CLCR_11015 [Cladophialophora carrionii]